VKISMREFGPTRMRRASVSRNTQEFFGNSICNAVSPMKSVSLVVLCVSTNRHGVVRMTGVSISSERHHPFVARNHFHGQKSEQKVFTRATFSDDDGSAQGPGTVVTPVNILFHSLFER
jgi:hypothetical protein